MSVNKNMKGSPASQFKAVVVSFAIQLVASVSGDAWINDTLKGHNQLRSQYGAPPLVWEEELVTMANGRAREFAETGIYPCTNGKVCMQRYGMNAFGGSNDITEALSVWSSEASKYDWSQRNVSESTAHFTQTVWKQTSGVACARTKGRRQPNGVVVCLYHLAGNRQGLFQQNVGRPRPVEDVESPVQVKQTENVESSMPLVKDVEQKLEQLAEQGLQKSQMQNAELTVPQPEEVERKVEARVQVSLEQNGERAGSQPEEIEKKVETLAQMPLRQNEGRRVPDDFEQNAESRQQVQNAGRRLPMPEEVEQNVERRTLVPPRETIGTPVAVQEDVEQKMGTRTQVSMRQDVGRPLAVPENVEQNVGMGRRPQNVPWQNFGRRAPQDEQDRQNMGRRPQMSQTEGRRYNKVALFSK